ncbi:MAG: hypothetical protein GXP37_14390 [Chloroflexi bacterium]|nr:hypothetical protein [Chloroflexota bacterium]
MLFLQTMGSHTEMGRQHAAQVRAYRAAILHAMNERLTELDQLAYDYRPVLEEAGVFMEEHGRCTWDMLRGIGEGLEIEWELLQRYSLSSYLLDYQHIAAQQSRSTSVQEGCTCFAVAAPLATEPAPLLAKNRDYRLDHINLQALIYSTPALGYRHLHLGSVGSTGVFSSGMNECGLAIADTHVVSLDIGPGLPRYALMQEILERCDSTAAACDYLRSVKHMGAGTLLLADQHGHLAMCESAYRQPDVRMQVGGWVVRTNHFLGERLRDKCLDTEPPGQQGNSEARYAFVAEQLAAAKSVDANWARALLSTHEQGRRCLCKHPDETTSGATILGAVFLPGTRQIWLGAGTPCEAKWLVVGFAD